MAASCRGDDQAYRRLLEELRLWLTRYYRRRLPVSLVDDAVQEALIAVHERRASYEPSRPLYPWVAAIARYKWADQIRDVKRLAYEPLGEELPVADHENAVLSASVLQRLMTALKPAQADVIRLVKLEGYSIVEASARTGQSNSLVKMNIHRGMIRLALMAERGR